MSRFIKDVAIMSTAPIITQLLGFLIIPIVTRYYSPENFGEASVFGAILMPFAVFANLGYGSAIISADSEKDASNLFALNLISTFFTSLLSLLILTCLSYTTLNNFNIVNKYFWIFPLSIIIHGFYISFRSLNIRLNRFNFISISQISRFISENSVKLFAAFTGNASAFFLIFGSLFGGVSSVSVLNIDLWKKNKSKIISDVNLVSIKKTAFKYIKFPKFILINDVFGRVSEQLPIYLLAIFFTQTTIGLYAIGLRLLTMPLNLFGGAIGDVFFQEAAKNKENISYLLEKIFNYLVLFSFSIFLFLGIFGEDIFFVLLGESWSEAGVYAQILSFYLFSKLITLPSSYLMIVYEKQEYSLYFNIVIIIFSVISLIIGGVLENVYLGLFLFSLSNSLVYLIYGIGFMKYSGLAINKILRIIFKNLIKNIPGFLILITMKMYYNSSDIIIMIIVLFIFVINLIIILLSLKESREFILRINK
jgi:O-antigen/teichoic acid export membrane protein